MAIGDAHFAVLFEKIESAGSVRYAYLLRVDAFASADPVYFVTSEVNATAVMLGGGSHYLGVFDSSGHSNLGSSDDWADVSKFFPEAIRIATERLGVEPEQVVPLDLPASRPHRPWWKFWT